MGGDCSGPASIMLGILAVCGIAATIVNFAMLMPEGRMRRREARAARRQKALKN